MYKEVVNMTKYTWIEGDVPSNLTIKQVYGIVFSDDKRIVLQAENDKYNLTGGKPEKGESYTDTLKREYLEEINIEIKDICYLGYLLVEEPDMEPYVQVRMIGKIENVKENRPDIDNGKLYKRHLVNVDNVKKYLNYKGEAGNQLIDSAISMAERVYSFEKVNFNEELV